ncbi:DUF917 domain-containing protein [Brevibacterium salitolerans]|uniref:DUF917 domain-containing protein n=1 Tax=Brevibacterium salitolerans TaxID=1403566 RepID=A0ABP5IT41_9MICO
MDAVRTRTGRLSGKSLEPIALGSRLLGCGGGGDSAIGLRLCERYFCEDAIEMIDPLCRADAGHAEGDAVALGIVGAGTELLSELLPSGDEFAAAVSQLARWGIAPAAVVPLEAGGINGLTAVAAASQLGLPVVDADLAGRALPRIDQFSSCLSGRSPLPAVLVDCFGHRIGVETDLRGCSDADYLERLIRALVRESAGWAVLGFSVGATGGLAEAVVPHTLTRARDLGLGLASVSSSSDLALWARTNEGTLLGHGTVSSLSRPRAQATGCFTVESRTGLIRIDMQNEFLLVSIDGEVVCTTPAIIGVLDVRRFTPLGADEIAVGTEVSVLVLPARFPRNAAGYRHGTGPHAFGIDHPPVLP